MASTTHGGGFARAAETEPGYKRSEVDRLFTRLAEDYEKLSGAAGFFAEDDLADSSGGVEVFG